MNRTDAVAQTVSGAGLVVSCLPMVAMLPGVAGSFLGVIGLGASSVRPGADLCAALHQERP